MVHFLKTTDDNGNLLEENKNMIMQLYEVNQDKLALSHKLKMSGKGSSRSVKPPKK